MAKKIQFDLEILNKETIERALENPALIRDSMTYLFTDASKLAETTAKGKVEGGLGMAVRTIKSKVEPMQMRTYTMLPKARARSIEAGRKPGTNPPYGQIKRWKEATGVATETRMLVKAIRARGVKGRFFMQGAKEAVANNLDRFLGRVATAMEKKWGQLT